MHLEVLVEDQSGEKMLEILIPKIIGSAHTFKITSYKGIGRLPRGLSARGSASKRLLLDQLPRLLRGYGKTFADRDFPAALIVVCDLDDRCLKSFRGKLFRHLEACNPKPETRFCLAAEEGEAWLLGDMSAIEVAYPKAKKAILKKYANDSVCSTWELLADAVHEGGSKALLGKSWKLVGLEKSRWAEKISPHMDVMSNASPSFVYFREKLRELAR